MNLRKVPWAWVVAMVGEERISAGRDVLFLASETMEMKNNAVGINNCLLILTYEGKRSFLLRRF